MFMGTMFYLADGFEASHGSTPYSSRCNIECIFAFETLRSASGFHVALKIDSIDDQNKNL